MSLSINPLSKLVSSVSTSISSAASSVQAGVSSAGAELSKVNLNQTVSRLSGEIGSGLNGLTAAAGQVTGSASTALGGIASQAQSLVSKVGSAAGSISNVTADIASSVDKLGAGNLAGGLMSAAGAISKTAGMLNNLLSLKRGVNLPSNGELFQQRGAVVSLSPTPGNDWRVRLNCNWELFNSDLFNSTLKETGGMVWPYLPSISVSSKANYTQIDPVHNNYPFNAYKNSQIDDIQITGEFSVENEADAYYWIAATTFLRTVTKMFYGTGPYVGNPPIVCQLTGYGSNVFNTVPVIVKSTSFDFKEDVQYIKCQMGTMSKPTWVPVMSSISVTVTPIYNRSRLRQFSLEDFAKGNTTSTPGFL